MTPFEMTKEKAIKLISKAEKGEFHYSDLEKVFLSVCQKSWKRYNDLFNEYELTSDGILAFRFFKMYIDESKFGLEYATKGKVRYIGTNNLSSFIIK